MRYFRLMRYYKLKSMSTSRQLRHFQKAYEREHKRGYVED